MNGTRIRDPESALLGLAAFFGDSSPIPRVPRWVPPMIRDSDVLVPSWMIVQADASRFGCCGENSHLQLIEIPHSRVY